MKKLISLFVFVLLVVTAVYASTDRHDTEINWYRRSKGLSDMRWSYQLQASSYKRAVQIVESNTMSHDGFAESFDMYYGKNRKIIGENIAGGYYSERDAINAWKESPAHNDVMLHKDACEFAISTYSYVTVLHVACR